MRSGAVLGVWFCGVSLTNPLTSLTLDLAATWPDNRVHREIVAGPSQLRVKWFIAGGYPPTPFRSTTFHPKLPWCLRTSWATAE